MIVIAIPISKTSRKCRAVLLPLLSCGQATSSWLDGDERNACSSSTSSFLVWFIAMFFIRVDVGSRQSERELNGHHAI